MLDRLQFTSRLIVITSICIAILALVLISPLLLLELSHVKSVNWQQLSNIGQTYGVSSAILSGIALVGVVFSLLVQARQARNERIRIVRERHMELLQIILDNPEKYAATIGVDPKTGADNIRSWILTTMWMNFARMGFQMDVLTKSALKADFYPSIFGSDFGRYWWDSTRKLWLNSPVPERRAHKFATMTDDEYQKACAAGPPEITVLNNAATDESIAKTKSPGHSRELIAVASGIVLGVIVRSRIRR